LAGQEVVALPFVVHKSFEGNNLVQQGKGNSLAKARVAKALECSTSDSRHKEIENVVVTCLLDMVAMAFEVPL